jgi:acetyl-CoA carboxylase carboxyltransferase component
MKDPAQAALVAQKSQEYKDTIMTPTIAAQRDYVSEIIDPEQTRERVARSLEFLSNKTQNVAPAKKHGNIPL